MKWTSIFTENLNYKIVSLFIALVLWLTILGRRDFTLSKNVEVDFLVASNVVVAEQSSEHVRVRVSGPRAALKKFMESNLSQLVSIDVTNKPLGETEVAFPVNRIDMPFGVRLVSVKPTSIRIRLVEKRAEGTTDVSSGMPTDNPNNKSKPDSKSETQPTEEVELE